MAEPFKFHLFVSYTRTPDGALAREIERFLEGFHQTPWRGDDTPSLPPLHVCVDGSDFSMPADAGGGGRDALDVVKAHLAQARELLVLCSAAAARKYWVAEEVKWFLANRGPAFIRLAYTEGARPWEEPKRYFPPPALEHGLEKQIAYDLRGYDARRGREWIQVPEFQREMVRLAADLLGKGQSAGDLYPTWLEAELARTRRQSLTLASTARFETLAGDPSRALLLAHEAHELHPGEVTERALREAYKVAVLHHHNRRESRISGSGPSYLAGRWKQGDVFTKTSPDGKYRLVATERGKDGPNPPGDVYVLSNETQRVVKLEPPDGGGGRVEDVAFDRASRQVFVTRYFNLACYGTDGHFKGGYAFSRHTKSPVHLVDGMFRGKYILGAETKGGVWLVDPAGDRDSTLTVHPEFYRDATIFTDISADQQRLLLVYESGRAAIVMLDGGGQPLRVEFAAAGVLFAGFSAGAEIITAHADGSVVLWEFDGESPAETARMKRLPSPVDWVTMDAAGVRLAAVGANGHIYLLDRESGEVVHDLDYSADVDWAPVRVVAVPAHAVEPGPAEEFGPAVPFPPRDLAVANLQACGGETWMFTEDWSKNEYYPDKAVYRVAGREACLLPGVHAALAEAHGRLLWMRVGPGYGGAAFCRVGPWWRRFPAKEVEANCMFERDGIVWVGTRAGGVRHDGEGSRLVTPPRLAVESVAEVGGRLWLCAREGAFVIENDRLFRVTDGVLQTRGITAAGGSVWILAKTDEMFAPHGPAYRVDGYFAAPFPAATGKVSAVLEADGAAWLAESERIHRVRGDEIRTVTGISPNVDGMVQAGRTLWLTTFSTGLLGGRQGAFRMDADTLEPVKLEFQASVWRAGDRAWLGYEGACGTVLAVPREDGLREMDFGGASVNRVAAWRDRYLFLTSAGVFREEGGATARLELPETAYQGLADFDDETWFLAADAAVRLRGDEVRTFRTRGFRPRAVRRIGDEAWILTSDGDAGHGPAYRISGRRAYVRRVPDGGVSDVVHVDGRTWLLTARGGRAGVLREA